MSSSSNLPSAALKVRRFVTREERLTRRSKSLVPYLRQEDSLCKAFLRLATCPREFEGLKLLFPFVREMSLFALKRTQDKFPTWMQLAFLAGHDLGAAYPEGLEEVVPGKELPAAVRRLSVLRQCSEEEHLTLSGLEKACKRIVQAQWKDVPESKLEAVLLEVVLKSLRTGFVTATFSRSDPVHCEFVWDMPDRTSDCLSFILSRALVVAARNAIGKAITELMEHPLLRLVREYYPGNPSELQNALDFSRERLETLGVTSENECPASEADLPGWIAAGLDWGRRLQAQCPEVIVAIFKEWGPSNLPGPFRAVREVAANGTEPRQLVQSMKARHERILGLAEPQCYGEELAQAVYFSDLAMWIPWVPRQAPSCPMHPWISP